MPTSTVAYNGLFYNKAIFEELNLSVPTTWDAFIELCQAIRDDGRYAVITCGAADQWPLNMFATGIMTSLYGQESETIGQGLFTGEIKHTDPQILELYAMMDQFASFLEPGVTAWPIPMCPAALPAARWPCWPTAPGRRPPSTRPIRILHTATSQFRARPPARMASAPVWHQV